MRRIIEATNANGVANTQLRESAANTINVATSNLLSDARELAALTEDGSVYRAVLDPKDLAAILEARATMLDVARKLRPIAGGYDPHAFFLAEDIALLDGEDEDEDDT